MLANVYIFFGFFVVCFCVVDFIKVIKNDEEHSEEFVNYFPTYLATFLMIWVAWPLVILFVILHRLLTKKNTVF